VTEFASPPLTETGWRVLTCAREEAVRLRAATVDTPHLLVALAQLDDGPVRRAFDAMGVGAKEIARHAEDVATPAEGSVPRPLPMSAHATAAMEGALKASKLMHADRVDAEHVLLGVLRTGGHAGDVLERAGVPLAQARVRALDALEVPPEARGELGGPVPKTAEADELRRAVEEARAEVRRSEVASSSPRPFPAHELTLAQAPFVALGRDKEVDKMREVFARGDRSSLFIIAPPGAGKRAVVRACASRLVQEAGTGYPRQQVYLFEPALAREAAPPIFMGEGAVVGRWLAEVLARAETGIFAFSQFVSDEWVYDDFLEFVVPACLRRWAVCVFLVTLDERRQLARRHPELTNVTFEIELPPLDARHAQELVTREAKAWPKSDRISIAETAAEAVVNLARKFLPSHAMPGAALEVLSRTRARVQREYAPRLPDFEKSIDALQRRVKEAVERGSFDEAASLRRERDAQLREYDGRLEKLQGERGTIIIGTGEIVKTVAEMTGKPEEEVRAGGVWT